MNECDGMWMEKAYKLAEDQMELGEVPVGCIIVYKYSSPNFVNVP